MTMNEMFTVMNNGLEIVMGWPLIIYVLFVSILCTLGLGFVQLRYFFTAWKWTFNPSKGEQTKHVADMSPLQAFINTLNISIGNGSLAGMATAIYSGGPGAALWVVIISILLMAVRYAEVYTSTYYAAHAPARTKVGGPMLYLHALKGGSLLAYLYAIFCMIFGFIVASAMQANSISTSMHTVFQIPTMITACGLLLFVYYVTSGGAQRVVSLSQAIVPIKVGLFFITAFIILFYHRAALLPSLQLILDSGLSAHAFAGGVVGFTVQHAMRYGILRSINATESGLGTAAILFGSTGSVHPVRDGIMSMVSTFVSALVCFLVALCIVVSGVWTSGVTGTALTIAAYNTVFGDLGGWIVTFLSIAFGMGVMVSYAYITKAAFDVVTGYKISGLFAVLYVMSAFLGARLGSAEQVTWLWNMVDLANTAMLVINLFGLVYLIPLMRKNLQTYSNTQG